MKGRRKGTKLTCGAIFILSDATECFVYRQATSLSNNSPLDFANDTIQAAQNVIFQVWQAKWKSTQLTKL